MAAAQSEVNYIDWCEDIKCIPFGSRLVMPVMSPSSRHTFDHYSKQAVGEPETYFPQLKMLLFLPEGSGVHAAATMLSYLAAASEKWYINTARRTRLRRPPAHTHIISGWSISEAERCQEMCEYIRASVTVRPRASETPRKNGTLNVNLLDFEALLVHLQSNPECIRKNQWMGSYWKIGPSEYKLLVLMLLQHKTTFPINHTACCH